MIDVNSQTLRLWRESKGWDVPRMARELRKAARDTGEDVAAHHGCYLPGSLAVLSG